MQCLNPKCLDTRAILPMEQQKSDAYCEHIQLAREAATEKRYASIRDINVDSLVNKLCDDAIETMLREHSIEGEIAVYVLPNQNIVVPSIYEDEAFVHVRYEIQLCNCFLQVHSKLNRKYYIYFNV